MAALLTLPPVSLHAASFDCQRASLPAEKKVCADDGLSKLDEQLAAAYKTALAQASDASDLKHLQRQWAQLRNGCGDQTACLKSLYQERLAELETGDDSAIFHFVGFSDSSSAEPLWNLVSTQLGLNKNPTRASEQHDRDSYARIGPDTFLVDAAALYVVQPTRGKVRRLESLPASLDWDPTFYPLPGNGHWVLLKTVNLIHGVSSQYYGAIFIKPPKEEGEPDVSGSAIQSFQGFDGGLCEEGSGQDESSSETSQDFSEAEKVQSVDVTDVNHDSMDDVIFHVAHQNCVTSALTERTLVFLNTGSDFKKPNESQAAATAAKPATR